MDSQNMEVVVCFKEGSLVTDCSKVKGHHKPDDGGLSVCSCDRWHRRKRVFGGGEASDEVEHREEEEAAMESASFFLLLLPPVISLPRLLSPSELQLLGHFGGNVSEG